MGATNNRRALPAWLLAEPDPVLTAPATSTAPTASTARTADTRERTALKVLARP